jgi:hypothetical protein
MDLERELPPRLQRKVMFKWELSGLKVLFAE